MLSPSQFKVLLFFLVVNLQQAKPFAIAIGLVDGHRVGTESTL
jgi:hypothetical protein